MTRRRPDPQRTLPGMAAAPRPRDATPVTLPMEAVGEGTPLAWLLKPAGSKAAPKWAPRSEVTRGEGPEAGLFTMPKWVAVERGWAK